MMRSYIIRIAFLFPAVVVATLVSLNAQAGDSTNKNDSTFAPSDCCVQQKCCSAEDQ